MARKHVVRSAAQGFNYIAYVGCSTDSDGSVKEDTAEEVIKGWEMTKKKAVKAVRDV